jgi:hypothetical protein
LAGCSNRTDNKRLHATSNEQKFFKDIYEKYPGEYYPLGSDSLFSESFNPKTGEVVWKFSFLPIDTIKTNEKRYLKEISDPVIEKYLPTTHFYYGKHSQHWELGSKVDFIGFLQNNNADFIFDQSTTDLNADFIQVVNKVSIRDQKEKENFTTALLTILAPGLLLDYTDYKKESTSYLWLDNTLTIKVKYQSAANEISRGLSISFKGNRVSSITLNQEDQILPKPLQ